MSPSIDSAKIIITLNPQYIKDTAGKKMVVLSAKQFNTIIEELEELEDIKAYNKTMNRKLEFVPLDKAIKEIEAARKKKNNVPNGH